MSDTSHPLAAGTRVLVRLPGITPAHHSDHHATITGAVQREGTTTYNLAIDGIDAYWCTPGDVLEVLTKSARHRHHLDP